MNFQKQKFCYIIVSGMVKLKYRAKLQNLWSVRVIETIIIKAKKQK